MIMRMLIVMEKGLVKMMMMRMMGRTDRRFILYRCDTRTMLTIMLLSLGLGYSYNIAIAVPSLIFIIIAAVNSQDR